MANGRTQAGSHSRDFAVQASTRSGAEMTDAKTALADDSERLIRALEAKLRAQLAKLDDLPSHGRVSWRRKGAEIEVKLDVTL